GPARRGSQLHGGHLLRAPFLYRGPGGRSHADSALAAPALQDQAGQGGTSRVRAANLGPDPVSRGCRLGGPYQPRPSDRGTRTWRVSSLGQRVGAEIWRAAWGAGA